MKQDDARKLDHATLEAMRIRAVRTAQAGENPEVVARSLRISRAGRYMDGWRNIGEVDGERKGQAAVWKTAQTACARHAMGLHYSDAEESVAAEICVRAVDARHGGQADPG